MDGEHEDGVVEKNGPAGGHEADLSEAGEQGAARREDAQGDDGFGGDAELEDDEGDERDEGGEENEGLNLAG